MKDFEIMRENLDYYKKAIKNGSSKYEPEIPLMIINESQYRWMELKETAHYPDFMDSVYGNVWKEVEPYISKPKIGEEYRVQANIENKLFDGLTVILKPYKMKGQGLGNLQDYTGHYYTDCGFRDNKLINPVIELNYPIYGGGYTLLGFIKTSLIHELTHVYDDVTSRRALGNNNISSNIGLSPEDEFLSDSAKIYNSDLGEAIKGLLYLRLDSERKAFLAQAMNELEELGCDNTNYREKMKETFLYKNAQTMKENVIIAINDAKDYELNILNRVANEKKTSLPKIPVGYYTDEGYRKLLINFSEKIYHDYIKRYYSMVMYYLTAWKGGHRVPKTGKTDFSERYFYP